MKDTLIEIKNDLQENNSRMDEAKNQINDLEHQEAKNNQSEQQKEKRSQKNEGSISSLWDKFKRSNNHVIEVPEGKKKEQEIGNLFEKIMKENSPNLVKETDMQIQETPRVAIKLDPKRPTPRHIIIKMPKIKDKEIILQTAKRKAESYLQRSSHKTTS